MPFIPFTDAWGDQNRGLAISNDERDSARPVLGALGNSFLTIWNEPFADSILSLLQVVQHLCDFTIIVENYMEGLPVTRPPAALTDQRNFTQHALMSLPPAREIENQTGDPCDAQYEPCRLACIVYSFLVIFPFPPMVGLFENVTARLQRSLLNMPSLSHTDRRRSSLQLWIVVMGSLMAIGLPERDWFVAELVLVMDRLEVLELGQFTALIQGFLWHPKTSGRDGLELWRAVQAARRAA